jgi:hypothetical protein
MGAFKTLISFVMLLAVAVHPLAAAAMPCCCIEAGNTKQACSRHEAKQDAAVSRSCCQQPHVPVEVLQPVGCCCTQAQPASATTRNNIPQSELKRLTWTTIELPGEAPTAVLRIEALSSARPIALSGPPLLALYCIWLK